MDFQKVAALSPVAFGTAFFGVYTARWLFDIPVPTPIADGLILGICGVALLVGFENARTGGQFATTLAQPLAIVAGFIVAEAVRGLVSHQQQLAGPTIQTYSVAVFLAAVLGGLAYGLGTQFGHRFALNR